ncbi:hypothetical protein ACQKP8_26700 [Photobacterium alginatilyticum]|uniref:hypothetical protein n=1 Tax=Photobacterium alginatilyticum TaxID=1775171 RepID=UPI004069548B
MKLDVLLNKFCGNLKLCVYPQLDTSLSQVLSKAGLYSDIEKLVSIHEEGAKEIVKFLLWKDLAYGSEIMSKSDAEEYVNVIFSDLVPSDSKFYTNTTWNDYHDSNTLSFASFTDATFDCGVIAVSDGQVFIFWVQAED